MHSGFAGIIDYAGLFPPASCTMDQAVANYAEYRVSRDRWMLSRFVVAASRLEEMAESVSRQGLIPSSDDPWGVSAVMSLDVIAGAIPVNKHLHGPFGNKLKIEAIETRAEGPGAVSVIMSRLPGDWELFLEVPWIDDYTYFMREFAKQGVRGKLRTGGTETDLFPSAELVASFIGAAVAEQGSFKLTAGLHHPWSGRYPLTYGEEPPVGRMFGYVAMLAATAALVSGDEHDTAVAILEEEDPQAFVVDASGIMWQEMRFSTELLERSRNTTFRSFGSCSFRDPVDELNLEGKV